MWRVGDVAIYATLWLQFKYDVAFIALRLGGKLIRYL